MGAGQAIKILRKQKGLTQGLLAKNSSLSQTYLSQVEGETKNPSSVVLRRIAEALGSSVAVIAWLSINESDIPANKIDAYRALKPSVDNLLTEFHEK